MTLVADEQDTPLKLKNGDFPDSIEPLKGGTGHTPLPAYAHPTPCPVLTLRTGLPAMFKTEIVSGRGLPRRMGKFFVRFQVAERYPMLQSEKCEGTQPICLRAYYTVSGTGVGYVLRSCYAMSGTGVAYGLRVCYAMSGTHIACDATTRYLNVPCLQLRALPGLRPRNQLSSLYNLYRDCGSLYLICPHARYAMSGTSTVSAFARATRCPVLTSYMFLPANRGRFSARAAASLRGSRFPGPNLRLAYMIAGWMDG
eukprot:143239-Rhodomonas_salina.5